MAFSRFLINNAIQLTFLTDECNEKTLINASTKFFLTT